MDGYIHNFYNFLITNIFILIDYMLLLSIFHFNYFHSYLSKHIYQFIFNLSSIC